MHSLKRTATLIAAVALAFTTLTGCGSDDAAKKDSKESSASERVATPTPTPTPEPEAAESPTITVSCDVKGPTNSSFTIDRINPDFRKAWATPLPEKAGVLNNVYCEFPEIDEVAQLTPVSEREQVIWDADKRPSKYTIPIPYWLCVEHGTRDTRNEWPRNKAQVRDAEAALTLCPRHPDAAAIKSRITNVGVLATQAKKSTFPAGNFRVGSRILPGTYFTTDVEDCYWERLDSSGEIIDNNFVSKAFRVQVSIASSDYSFHSEGCGQWRRVG